MAWAIGTRWKGSRWFEISICSSMRTIPSTYGILQPVRSSVRGRYLLRYRPTYAHHTPAATRRLSSIRLNPLVKRHRQRKGMTFPQLVPSRRARQQLGIPAGTPGWELRHAEELVQRSTRGSTSKGYPNPVRVFCPEPDHVERTTLLTAQLPRLSVSLCVGRPWGCKAQLRKTRQKNNSVGQAARSAWSGIRVA